MVDRKCSKCGEDKPRNMFPKGRTHCKPCIASYKREYSKKYRKENVDYIKKKGREYNCNNKEKNRKKASEYRSKNREKIRDGQKKYSIKNKNKIIEKNKNYYINNKKRILGVHKTYMESNRKACNERANDRRRQNPVCRLKRTVSSSIYRILKNKNIIKGGSTFKNLPYTAQELKEYIESKFESWMSWENWGIYDSKKWDDSNDGTWTWQMDHIIPHSFFKYTSMQDEEFKKCWKLSNLRPYSAKQNILNGNRRKNKEK